MIDIRPVGYILGWLVLVLGALMIPPLLVDLYDGAANAQAFAVAAVVTLVAGAATAVACAEEGRRSLSLRQGFLFTAGSWALFPAFAGLPLMLGEPHLDFTDAYFELTSAMTTTGGTVIVGLEHLPRGVLLWRGIVTWVGGMGVILLAMILLPILNIGGMQMLRNADFNTLGKIMPRAKTIALSIGATYLVLTVACALAYVWAGMSGFDGLCARLLDRRHRRDGQLRQLVRGLQPGGAVRRHGLHAARGDVVRPLRAAGAGRAEGALRGQPDPRVPGDLRRARARPRRRARACRRRDRRAAPCARWSSTSPRSSARPASPRPTTRCGDRWPRCCSSAR